MRVLSAFFTKNWTDKGCFISDIGKNTSEINFFLGFIVEFFRQVVVMMSDVDRQKVKRYLFLQGADLTFRGSTQVVCHDSAQWLVAVRLGDQLR